MGNCYCFTCDRYFHSLGIARHRAMHRDRREDCRISTRNGTYTYGYSLTNQQQSRVAEGGE